MTGIQEVAIKDDSDKPDLHAIDPIFLDQVAIALSKGEDKYGVDNWKNGLSFSRILSAMKRHVQAIERGENIDLESGMPHATHVACNAMIFDYYRRNYDKYKHLDDRRWK